MEKTIEISRIENVSPHEFVIGLGGAVVNGEYIIDNLLCDRGDELAVSYIALGARVFSKFSIVDGHGKAASIKMDKYYVVIQHGSMEEHHMFTNFKHVGAWVATDGVAYSVYSGILSKETCVQDFLTKVLSTTHDKISICH